MFLPTPLFKKFALPEQESGSLKIGPAEIGYTIHRKKGRRRIALYIEPPGKLRLLVPMRARNAIIESILHDRRQWIADRIASIGPVSSITVPPQKFTDGATAYFLGEPYALRITHDAERAQDCRIESTHLEINLPHSPAAGEALEQEARLECILWYKKRAKEILKERTDFWSEQLGLRYRRFAVGSAATQWGSCSAKNDLRYNWRVIMAPPAVIDYLVVHELCHIKEKNHSRAFWRLLSEAIPDYKERRKLLKSLDAGFTM